MITHFRFWLSDLFLALAAITIPPGIARDRFYEMIELFGFAEWPPEIDPHDAELIGLSGADGLWHPTGRTTDASAAFLTTSQEESVGKVRVMSP